jgi:hypothetical protein
MEIGRARNRIFIPRVEGEIKLLKFAIWNLFTDPVILPTNQ